MGAVAQMFSSSGSTSPQKMLAEAQAQFVANFDLQTQASMSQNTQQTYTSIGTNEAQSLASSGSGASEVGRANAKIVA